MLRHSRPSRRVARFWHSNHDAAAMLGEDVGARMGEKRASRWSCVAGACLVMACASAHPPSPRDLADANDTGRSVRAVNESERALLQQITRLPTGAPLRVGSTTVVAEPLYYAASGRPCRAIHITAPSNETSHRLSCSDGKGWFFVPDVFGRGVAE
jgi:hypothetical protein